MFLNPIDGLGVNLLSYEGAKLGASVNYDFGRKESKSRKELSGLGDIKGGAKGTLFASYQKSFLKAKVSLNKEFAGAKGLTTEFGLDAFIPLAALMGSAMPLADDPSSGASKGPNGPILSLGMSTIWADKDHMRGYFGVTAAQSAASGLTQFTAKSGFKSVTGSAGLIVPVTEHVTLGTAVEYSKLLGDASDSPVTRRDHQISTRLFTVYKF